MPPGVPVDFFCYLVVRYDSGAIRRFVALGYRRVTTVEGLARPEAGTQLRRVRVNGSDGVDEPSPPSSVRVEQALSDVANAAAMFQQISMLKLIEEIDRYLAAIDLFAPKAASRRGSS